MRSARGRARGSVGWRKRTDYRILGPLEVADGDRAVALGGDRQRAVLGHLLLYRNEVVASERLIDELWGERRLPLPERSCRTTFLSCAGRWVRTAAVGRWRRTGGAIGCGSSRWRSTSSVSSAAWSPAARRWRRVNPSAPRPTFGPGSGCGAGRRCPSWTTRPRRVWRSTASWSAGWSRWRVASRRIWRAGAMPS